MPKRNINEEFTSHQLHIIKLFTESGVSGGHRVARRLSGRKGGAAGGMV